MPGRDGTGPSGMGGMTGRGAGRCARLGGPAPAGRGWGRGFGMGFGRRLRGWRRFGGNLTPSQPTDAGTERQGLKDQAEGLKS